MRRLNNGDKVPELDKPVNLTIKTKCPKKWIIKDNFGDITTVLIQNAKYNKSLSHLLFFPEDFPDEIN